MIPPSVTIHAPLAAAVLLPMLDHPGFLLTIVIVLMVMMMMMKMMMIYIL